MLKRLKALFHELVISGIQIKLINIPGHAELQGDLVANKYAKDTAYKIHKGEISAGGDTVAPSGLYVRLCHTFLVTN